MHFAAFISYKHAEPDQSWANWLHSKLETYRVPKGITAPQIGGRLSSNHHRSTLLIRCAAQVRFALSINSVSRRAKHLQS